MQGLYTDVYIENGFWDTILTEEGLLMLLEQTPTIRDFDREKDAPALKQIQALLVNNGEIVLRQHRILVCARKL